MNAVERRNANANNTVNMPNNREASNDMNTTNRNVDVEETHVQKKSDSSLVLSTLIKYTAYLVIFFGILYFLVNYVFTMF
ncbi:hypothetical protein [Paenibacillus sp. HB172176]|uniref:hypothetical protein n=1 Tax=Paenibacillus sp. HB172176 TaxID=2493690 RepID=UPI00143CC054|nr:hypothetical protein [Paenibacillus sp. HB172176]